MNKPPEKTIEYIPNIDDEKEYVIDVEIIQLTTKIESIKNGFHHNSPVYNKLIIPQLHILIDKLVYIQKIIDSNKTDKHNNNIEKILDNII